MVQVVRPYITSLARAMISTLAIRSSNYLFTAAMLVAWLMTCAVRADEGDDTLRYYLSNSPQVVSGEIIGAFGLSTEAGVYDYATRLKVTKTLKGAVAGDEKSKIEELLRVDAQEKQIRVGIMRFEQQHPTDRSDMLTKNARVILFLRRGVERIGEGHGWMAVDLWFAVQPAGEAMEKALLRLAPDSEPAPEPVDVAENGKETLRYYKSKAPLVVSGEIAKISPATYSEDSTCTRSLRVKVTKIMRGGVQGDEITARIVRFEKDETEAPAFLKTGKRVILFLHEQGDGYQTVDPWFGVQQYNSVMEEEIDSAYAETAGKP